MPRLTRTIPTIRRTSQRLTWRPGVNQRTTRGFIRKGATGAPSLAQHFLNSFHADFVTSIGLYSGPRRRAYNRPRVLGSVLGPVHAASCQGKRRSSVDGDQDRRRYPRVRGAAEGAGAVLGVPRRGGQALRRRQGRPDDPRSAIRDRGLRGHPGLLEPRARAALRPQATGALPPDAELRQAAKAQDPDEPGRALRNQHRADSAQQLPTGRLHSTLCLQEFRRDRGASPQPQGLVRHLRHPVWQLRRGRWRHPLHGVELAAYRRQRRTGSRQDHWYLSQLQKLYFDSVRGRNNKYRSWLSPVY